MFVFRVEDNSGAGPYGPVESDICNIFQYHRAPQHYGYYPDDNHFFAWESLEKFKEMVDPYWMKKFNADTDWMLSIYEVKDNDNTTITCPDGQVMFYKSRARLVKRVKFGNINRLKKYK